MRLIIRVSFISFSYSQLAFLTSCGYLMRPNAGHLWKSPLRICDLLIRYLKPDQMFQNELFRSFSGVSL